MFHSRKIEPVTALPGLHYPMPIPRGRARTRDMLTFDAQAYTTDTGGNMRGKGFEHRYTTHDGKTVDSSGAFMVGELERLDQTLHEPLAAVSWGRDVPLREDVTIADDVSSYTVSNYGSQGGLGTGNGIGNGKSWMGKVTTQVTGVGVDIAKVTNPLTPWADEVKYTIFELEAAAKAGRPIDQQKYNAMQLKHQMDIDEQVYFGDTPFAQYGLMNSDNRSGLDDVTNVTNVANGAQGTPGWSTKTPDEILADVNELFVSVWSAAAWAEFPDRLLVPPSAFGYISSQKVSEAGNLSILGYLQDNNILRQSGISTLKIYPSKWCIGTGVGGTVGVIDGHDRMVAYRYDKERLRYPMTLLQRTPVQYEGVYHKSTYYCKLGVLEIVYPELIGYRDGL